MIQLQIWEFLWGIPQVIMVVSPCTSASIFFSSAIFSCPEQLSWLFSCSKRTVKQAKKSRKAGVETEENSYEDRILVESKNCGFKNHHRLEKTAIKRWFSKQQIQGSVGMQLSKLDGQIRQLSIQNQHSMVIIGHNPDIQRSQIFMYVYIYTKLYYMYIYIIYHSYIIYTLYYIYIIIYIILYILYYIYILFYIYILQYIIYIFHIFVGGMLKILLGA